MSRRLGPDFFQTNTKGVLIDALRRLDRECAAYCICNPGGCIFTCVALLTPPGWAPAVSGFGPASCDMALFYIPGSEKLLA
jgi:hypothetical protein